MDRQARPRGCSHAERTRLPNAILHPMFGWVQRAGTALLPAGIGIAVFALLAAFAGVDPASGVTVSNSPFTDEAWNVLNARNLIVLGTWARDDWNRQLVSVPFSLLHALSFAILGVGIIQARLVEIASVALMAVLVAAVPRRVLGTWPPVLGAVALSTSTLVLYYGRLVYLEPLTALGLTIAALLVLAIGRGHESIAGVAAGVAVACAIGTKLLALPDAVGLAGGVLLIGYRMPPCRRWLVGLAVGLAACTMAWAILEWLPNRDIIAAVVRTWPPEAPPSSLEMIFTRITEYLSHNDRTYLFSAPLLIGAGVGLVVGILRWPALGISARFLFAAGLGWAVAGLGVLAIVPYAPNRYVVPTLPALALLVMVGAHAAAGWLPGDARRRLLAGTLLGLAAAILLAGPGLWRYASWMRTGTARLPAIQERVREIIPSAATVEGGYAPLFAMRATATTIITNFGANPGDLYASRYVRWFVGSPRSAPPWAGEHPDAWAARQAVFCATWARGPVCVYRLP